MVVTTLIVAPSDYAQKDSSGVYKTTQDFLQRKLSFAINCKTEKHKINTDLIFKGSEIKVKHEGINYRFKKNEIFGYRTCEGKEFRFVDDKEYSILNPGETLIIYMYKRPSGGGRNNVTYHPKYYFSYNSLASLQDLTKANIKALYPENHKLHNALDAQFKDDSELFAYDDFHKTYKLNWIIKNNLN
tara:strand:+ start:221 stop:781 length:561 start_codon:yes stop_codon:yes gene_type:complete